MAKWQSLASHSLESAGFNAPELVLPILKHQPAARLVTVQQASALHFALPVQLGRFFTSSWSSIFSTAGTPHISEGLKEASFSAFLAAQNKPFLFNAIPADGSFHNLAKSQSQHCAILESWSRACLRPVGTYSNWLQTNFDQKRRKEFNRLRNRLSEQGNLQTITLAAADNADSFADEFLSLEASGWKGKRGTALGVDAKRASVFRELVHNLHAAGKLRFWSLQLDGKSIASLFAVVEGKHAWLGKIAYDENYAKYSPGALIILDCTEGFFSEPEITQIDSRAVPNHPLIDRIWRDRLPMISIFVAPETISKLKFNSIVMFSRQKLKLRSRLRDNYYKARGKKRS